jgi:hypothetical protein
VLNRVDESYPQRVDAALKRAHKAYENSCIAKTQQAPESMEEVDEAQLLQYENMEQLLPTLPKQKVEVLQPEEEGLGGGGHGGAVRHGRKGVEGEWVVPLLGDKAPQVTRLLQWGRWKCFGICLGRGL